MGSVPKQSTPLRDMLITIVKAKSAQMSDEDVVCGMVHTIAEQLGITKRDIINILIDQHIDSTNPPQLSLVELIDMGKTDEGEKFSPLLESMASLKKAY